MIVFLIDNIITTQILLSLELNIISIKKDQTEEISQKIKNKLNKNFYLKKRLLNAFNFITEEKDNYINKIKKIINNINKDKKTKR
ncbi:MAG: hypothetical protein GX861_01395 [Tenericutes bacterium]|nr:hypothetical protein [Mycoplasmatota bacterium]